MQADCLAEYLQGVRANPTGEVVPDLVCTATFITWVNTHLYGSAGEHRVERPGEGNVTGKAFLEAGLVVKVLERHSAAVQAYANRARSLATGEHAMDHASLTALERDLDEFVQTIMQDLQRRHHSD